LPERYFTVYPGTLDAHCSRVIREMMANVRRRVISGEAG